MSVIAPLSAVIDARVLLIEDDRRDVELAIARLERANFNIELTHVAHRDELLDALDDGKFDVILCDFQLPGFSGAEALEIVKAHALDVPFIFLSGVLGEENAVEMLRRGATDYVVKQRMDRLPIAVRRALNEAEERRGRVQAELSLRKREAYFSKMVDSLKDYSVVALSPDAQIESWNVGSQTIFGYGAPEVLGRNVAMLLPDNDSVPALSGELEHAASEGSSRVDRWLTRKDGTPFYASIVISAIRDQENTLLGYSHIVRDTTDSRIAADLLQVAKEQAESANSAKDRFLAVLSHELRTPLNPIALAAKYLELLEDMPPAARESIDIIKRNIRIETRLIDDLLDVSRIVNNKLTLDFARVDVSGLVHLIVASFTAEALERGIQIDVNGCETALAVRGDSERLQQIIGNVIKNALKFTGRGGRIAIAVAARGDAVDIEVRDNGVGISPDDLQRIFQAFEQGQNSSDTARGGLGLGLAIAHALAEKHGGRLAGYSDGIGQGARFVLTLERHHKQERAQEVAATARTEQSEDTLAKPADEVAPLRILLVEDDRDTLRAEQTLLEIMGYDVTTAYSVATAREQLQSRADGQTYDVLLSDIGLPDGSGVDVLETFRASGGQYAIALTGFGMPSDQQHLHAAGFSQHLVKPLKPDYLLGLLQAAAHRKSRSRADL